MIIVKEVQTLDDIVKLSAIRGASFISRGEPFAEEFDGEDLRFTTHLLAEEGGEPVGTFRVRWAGGDAVFWERLSIVPSRQGNVRLLLALVSAARELSHRMSAAHVIGYVEDKRLVNFWKRQGAVLHPETEIYGGKTYRKLTIELN